MVKRRRFKQSMPLKDRLAAFSEDMREKASRLKPGTKQETLLCRARQADTAADFDEWASSPVLSPTKKNDTPGPS
jgi:hypothetical protein